LYKEGECGGLNDTSISNVSNDGTWINSILMCNGGKSGGWGVYETISEPKSLMS